MSENNFDEEVKKQTEEAKGCLFRLFAFAAIITVASAIHQIRNPPKESEVVTTTTKTETRANNEEATLDQSCVNRVTQEIADRENDYGDRYINKEEAIKYTLEIAQRCKKKQ